MVTDRCLIEGSDLPIPKLDVAGAPCAPPLSDRRHRLRASRPLAPVLAEVAAVAPALDFEVRQPSAQSRRDLESGALDLLLMPQEASGPGVVWAALHDNGYTCAGCGGSTLSASDARTLRGPGACVRGAGRAFQRRRGHDLGGAAARPPGGGPGAELPHRPLPAHRHGAHCDRADAHGPWRSCARIHSGPSRHWPTFPALRCARPGTSSIVTTPPTAGSGTQSAGRRGQRLSRVRGRRTRPRSRPHRRLRLASRRTPPSTRGQRTQGRVLLSDAQELFTSRCCAAR